MGKDWRYDGTDVQVPVLVHYRRDLLAEFGLTDCKPVKTLSELKINDDTTAALDSEEHAMYRRAVEKVMYAEMIRPDVQFTVKELARRLAAPIGANWLRFKRLLRYLKGTQDYVLNFTVYNDSDAENIYAACLRFWSPESFPSRHRSPNGKLILRRPKNIDNLRSRTVWCESIVVEWPAMRKQNPTVSSW